jgi:hypothetical protein
MAFTPPRRHYVRQATAPAGRRTRWRARSYSRDDEVFLHVVPLLLGDGIRLFASPAARQITLEQISVGQSGQVTDLRFRVVNPALR